MRRLQFLLIVLLVAGAIAFVARSGRENMRPAPPGTFSFAVLGDAPYYVWEELRYRFVLQSMDASDLRFVLHVGDIFWRPCSDARYAKSRDQFNRLRHPVIYTPGDNEWADCWEAQSGGFLPLERLARLRQIFYPVPARSLGARPIALAHQRKFIENARWEHQGIVFATVHLIGSSNGFHDFPVRTAADDTAARERTAAAVRWMRETFAEARGRNASAVVLGFHANLELDDPPGHPYRQWYESFTQALEEEVERFAKPVLIVQGDDHEYAVDHPLTRRTTGKRLTNFTRMQVPGSPDVGWVRVTVTPGASAPFAFDNYVVPRWKYW